MIARHYQDMIVRAVIEKDEATLDLIAAHLADCEVAKQMLRAKGYGETGMPVSAAVRLVPTAKT